MSDELWQPFLWALPAAAGWMSLCYVISRWVKNAGVVDAGWALGTGLAGFTMALTAPGWPARQWLVGLLILLWSLRLFSFIVKRRVLPGREDRRYQALRAHWGDKADFYFYFFFLVQALFILLFSVPARAAALVAVPHVRMLDLTGLLIWLTAVIGESVADRQLHRFTADPANRGRTCRTGLWRYSRHPNYFFEWVHWFAYVAIAAGSSQGGWALFGPVFMFIFLYKITGIPQTEKQAIKSRGDDYRAYQKTTSPFIPWPPKKQP